MQGDTGVSPVLTVHARARRPCHFNNLCALWVSAVNQPFWSNSAR
jgi:hypothetical protein